MSVNLGFVPSILLQATINRSQRVSPYEKQISDLFNKYPAIEISVDRTHRSYRNFFEAFDPITKVLAYRSICWMFARTLPENPLYPEGDSLYMAGFYKEFNASQVVFWDSQIRDYSCLLGLESLRGIGYNRSREARRVAINLAWRIGRLGILYPTVQRKKSVGRDTAELYMQYHPEIHRHGDVKTVHLEKHYYETGVMLPGPSEMRVAWKFNDLKPRIYYAQGGDAHFAGRYAKRLAIALMESNPITEMKRRRNPDYYLSMDEDEYLTYWDYESFTTNLSELKYFLYYVALSLTDLAVHDLRIFDYREGLIHVSPVDVLMQYNESVNVQAQFSVHRIVERFGLEVTGSSHLFRQQNSGMLGVAGNIGFSTGNHGYVLLETVGPDKGVCVGDDAFGIGRDKPDDEIIPAMSELGPIHRDKFGCLDPGEEGPFRFLKRAFYRNPDGSFFKEELLVFPLAPFIDGDMDHRDVFGDCSLESRIFKVVTAVGQLLWAIHGHPDDYTGRDLDEIHHYLRATYMFLGIPRSGFLPGYILHLEGVPTTMRFAAPSINFLDYSPLLIDWVDWLCITSTQPDVIVPCYGPAFIPNKPSKGETIIVTMDRFWTALEDIELVKMRKLSEVRSMADSSTIRDLKKWLKSTDKFSKAMYELTVLEDIPPRFDFFFRPGVNMYEVGFSWEQL